MSNTATSHIGKVSTTAISFVNWVFADTVAKRNDSEADETQLAAIVISMLVKGETHTRIYLNSGVIHNFLHDFV